MKRLIKSDKLGLWASAGGWVARPVDPSRYAAGEKVDIESIPQSCFAGVGRNKGDKKNKYVEIWVTTGVIASIGPAEKREDEGRFLWYLSYALAGNPRFKRVLSDDEKEKAYEWFKNRS